MRYSWNKWYPPWNVIIDHWLEQQYYINIFFIRNQNNYFRYISGPMVRAVCLLWLKYSMLIGKYTNVCITITIQTGWYPKWVGYVIYSLQRLLNFFLLTQSESNAMKHFNESSFLIYLWYSLLYNKLRVTQLPLTKYWPEPGHPIGSNVKLCRG